MNQAHVKRMARSVRQAQRRRHVDDPSNQFESIVRGLCFVTPMKFGLRQPISIEQLEGLFPRFAALWRDYGTHRRSPCQ